MGMDIFLEASVIVRRTDNSTIAQYVYAAAISGTPSQNDKTVALLSFHPCFERNRITDGS